MKKISQVQKSGLRTNKGEKMSSFLFAILDPRKTEAAIAANEAIFASGLVYGVEVTVPALAARCVGNLDPQHSGGNAKLAAIEAAMTV